MPITSFTTLNRQVIRDLRTLDITDVDGNNPGTVPVEIYFAGAATREKNPDTPRYPGLTLHINAPRLNPLLQTYETVTWRVKDPANPDFTLIRVSEPPKSYWQDYRVTIYTKYQPQFDDLVRNLTKLWDRGKTQLAIRVSDEDTVNFPDLVHNLDVRVVMLVTRHRPQDNVFMADYLITVPIHIYDIPPLDQPPVETLEITLTIMDDDQPDLVLSVTET